MSVKILEEFPPTVVLIGILPGFTNSPNIAHAAITLKVSPNPSEMFLEVLAALPTERPRTPLESHNSDLPQKSARKL